MNDMCANIKESNLNKQRKIFIIFDGAIADILVNNKYNQIVTELFIITRELNISLALIMQS